MAKRLASTAQIQRIWRHLLPRRRRQLAFLATLMITVSFAEVLSIGAVMPFLGVLVSPDKIFEHNLAKPFIQVLHIQSAQELMLPITLIFISAALFAGFGRITLLWVQTRLSMAIGADLSVQVYERTLYRPYSQHVSCHSSEILSGVRKAENLAHYIIQPVLGVISSLVVLSAVISALAAIQPLVILIALLGFGLIYFLVANFTKRRVIENSEAIAIMQGKATKTIQEGLGGIRDVIINRSELAHSKAYRDIVVPLQSAVSSNLVVGASPRFGIEALGMVLIAALAYGLVTANGVNEPVADVIPILGVLALGAQRILPLLQQIYFAYVTIKGSQASIEDALDLLDQPVSETRHLRPTKPIVFQAGITLENVSFRYDPQGAWVLRQLNLEISRGSRVGFIGATGSGKSTLLDILVGLLRPTKGSLIVDNTVINPDNCHDWHAHIAQVPQSIYLLDASITENIAFGEQAGPIDLARVKQAARQAQISQVIEGWSGGYQTRVGENGVRLSGGQRQRIGIARALYKDAKILIFDEATSALDNETEKAVMDSLEFLGREITILLVAHRISTLKGCDQIIELEGGRIKAKGDFRQIANKFSI